MLQRTFTYEDYDGNVRSEDVCFDLNETEILEMNLEEQGGLERTIDQISKARDGKRIFALFKSIVLKAYAVKSPDGRKLLKSDALRDDFVQTPMYNQLMLELVSDPDKANAFISAIIPKVKQNAPAPVAVQ